MSHLAPEQKFILLYTHHIQVTEHKLEEKQMWYVEIFLFFSETLIPTFSGAKPVELFSSFKLALLGRWPFYG